MLSFGEDLARLAEKIVSGHESRTAAITGIRNHVQESRSTENAKRADARAERRMSMAAAAAARSADLNRRSAGVRQMRQENQAGMRVDTATLRLNLDAARQQIAEKVKTLRQAARTEQETTRAEQAKTAADLHKHLADAIAKARSDMQRQFAAARAVWPDNVEIPWKTAASGAKPGQPGAKAGAGQRPGAKP